MLKRISSAVALAAAIVTVPAQAQDNPAESRVLATVNGEPITAADVNFATTTLGDTLQRVPESQRGQMVLNLVIDMHLLADAAKEQGLEEDEAFKERADYLVTQALREYYMEKVINDAVSEADVKARYDEEVANLGEQKEVSASHILVKEEAKAKELIEELNSGADFGELAEANSIDPGSKTRGGSLGFFRQGQMVPPFEEAAFALEPGEMTEEPVESRFGWHIIRVDETRPVEVPGFEDVAPQIRQLLVRDAYMAELEKLKETATIEFANQE